MEKTNIKTHIEAQKIPDSKNNPEQKKRRVLEITLHLILSYTTNA